MTGRVLADRSATNLDGREAPTEGSGTSDNCATLRVLGQFNLTVGDRSVQLGATSQRLLVLVATRSGQIPRVQAAGILWPDTRTQRATANLRSALWRLHQCCQDVLDASYYDLRIAPGVRVDIHEASEVAYGLVSPCSELSREQLGTILRCNLYDDLAPDVGDDNWLVAERERFRQLRVHALEGLANQLIKTGWYGAAVEAALGAVRADPFRESAYHLLIKAYLSEGSQLEARRQYNAYCELLRTELGLAPSHEFIALLNTNGRHQPSMRAAITPQDAGLGTRARGSA